MRATRTGRGSRAALRGQVLLTLLLVVGTWSGVLANLQRAAAAPTAGATAHPLLAAIFPAQAPDPVVDANELAGMTTQPIAAGDDSSATMRQRPFIVGENSAKVAFNPKTKFKKPKDLDKEDGAKAELIAFLTKRGVAAKSIEKAVARYDDRAVKAIVPAPQIRAALLMMTDWDPYQATIAAILDGKNPSGKPFTSVDFDKVSMSNAIAETYEDPATGLDSIVVGNTYKKEMPELLIPFLVHESMHGGRNSAEEEIIANFMNTLCWAEMLKFDPELALIGSDLSIELNLHLVALLNSIGRAGPEEVGVATSPYGDVLIGINLLDIDIDLQLVDYESLRAMIESLWLYDALLNIGSDGQYTTYAMLKRFPGSKALGKNPRYDEVSIALIDAGIYKIITQEDAVKLAALLNLEKTTKFKEVSAKGTLSDDFTDSVGRRPFVASDPKIFSYSKAATTSKPLSEEGARKWLQQWFALRDADAAVANEALAKFDAPETQIQIPDPTLRAAALSLYQFGPWQMAYSVIIDGKNPDGVPLRIQYVPKRDSAPVQRRSDTKGDGTPPSILVNSLLVGESPELLASLLVEASLLHDATLLKEEAISAAAIGTLAWADIIALEPTAATARTWGVLQRNLYLLAMLNTKGMTTAIGILQPPSDEQGADVLVGVFEDATTFTKMIDQKPWGVHFDRSTELVAPPFFVAMVRDAGIKPHTTTDGLIAYGDYTLLDLDVSIEHYLTPDKVMTVAKALKLKTLVAAS